MNKYEGREVVVTGLGPVSPIGVGKESFGEALKKGKSGIKKISLFDTSGLDCQIGGEIDSELTADIAAEIGGPVSRGTSFAIKASKLALKDAGISEDDFSSLSSSIYMGISTTDMGIVESEYLSYINYGSVNSKSVFSSSPHAPSSQIANALKCSGKVLTISTGCSGGLISIISGVESILQGETEIALAGGSDAPLTPFLFAGFSSAGLLSTTYNNKPYSASRPFDSMRDSGVLSEGAGMLLLENSERARLRNARLYGKIAGWGISNASSPLALKKAFVSSIDESLKKASIFPERLDYICANGPGEKITDRAEVKAIKECLGAYAYNLPVSSIKSMIGYPLAASGPLQVIAALQTMQQNYVPPTINYEYPDPYCDLDFVPNKGRTSRINTALINLSGLGGSIVSLVVTVK